jgi:spore coat protein A
VLLTRRIFLQAAAASAVSPPLNPNLLEKFADPLPRLEVAKPAAEPSHYRIAMRETRVKIHRDLPPTRVWTFGGSFPGPTIEARSGEAVTVEWRNELPLKHFLPIDHNLHGAEADKPEVRTVVHVHGAKVPPESDGYPERWYTPGHSATFRYPNEQDAALLFYHDHSMGITRLNNWAGLFGLYIIRDRVEDDLDLPRGEFEIPMIVCDRLLRRDGQLDYPRAYGKKGPWIAEAFGDVLLVNGKAFPYLDVQPRAYRLRILNGSNGRFYHLSLSNDGPMRLIGCDQGLLPAPITVKNFLFAPGERVDVVVDFADYAGEKIILKSNALEIMQFRVGRADVPARKNLPAALRPFSKTPEAEAVQTRLITIDEYMNQAEESMLMLLNNAHWDMPVTEKPVLNTTEIWSIVNPTDDSHPIHLHLVRFQLLDRQNYDSLNFAKTGKLRFTGPRVPPEPHESGWKDTVRAHSKMVTRFIVHFAGYPGRYVWHCHILEHEDNEMMRPYEIVSPPA